MARILLIKCSHLTFFHNSITFPMGVMQIASILRNNGHQVKILDLRLSQKKSEQCITNTMKDFQPHAVGLSSLTIEAPSLHYTASIVKNLSPQTFIIAGGPHPTSFPEEVLLDKHIDCISIGEGEATAPELFDSLLDGGNLSRVKGIAFLQDGQATFTDPRPPIEDLDSLPFPAWDLVEVEKYKNRRGMAGYYRRYMNLFTSRACPYKCIYCHTIFGKGFRARSPENVLEEIITIIKKYNIYDFEILDDIFNIDSKRAMTIYDMIIRNGLGISLAFPNGLRCDRIEDDHIRMMKQAGVIHVSVAVETASPRLQKIIKKNLIIPKVDEFIRYCDRLKINTRGFFMIGLPTESSDEIMETIKFALQSRLHTALFFITIPFKDTELYNTYKEKLKDTKIEFSRYNYLTGTFNLSEVSDEELLRLQRYAYRRFYMDPWRILSIYRTFPLKRHLPILFYVTLKYMLRQEKNSRLVPEYFTS